MCYLLSYTVERGSCGLYAKSQRLGQICRTWPSDEELDLLVAECSFEALRCPNKNRDTYHQPAIKQQF